VRDGTKQNLQSDNTPLKEQHVPHGHVATTVALVFLVHVFKLEWNVRPCIVQRTGRRQLFGERHEIIVRAANSLVNTRALQL